MNPFQRTLLPWLVVAFIIAGCSDLGDTASVDSESESATDSLKPSVLEVPAITVPLTFLPPLGPEPTVSGDLDRSLLDVLTVEACEIVGDECALVASFDADGRGGEKLRIEDEDENLAFYLVNWNTGRSEVEPDSTRRIRIVAAGLELGRLDVQPGTRGETSRTWPIKFHVESHPLVRVRVSIEQGLSATEIAQVLRDEFAATATEIAALLAGDQDPFGAADIAVALQGAGFTAAEIVTALDDALGSVIDAILVALEGAGFTAQEITAAFSATLTQEGEVNEVRHAHGSYQLYVPTSHTSRSKVVVVVHGTPPDIASDVVNIAEAFIDRWTDFADEHGTVIIAPAFDQTNFASHSGSFGGYRGLYGRTVGADEFVHAILDQVGSITPVPTDDRRFLLYGHSAGGQFASRYVVRHPDRILAAVLGAPGRFAFPDPTASWHLGMGNLDREIDWSSPDETQRRKITPDPQGWLEAATLPITVLVGDQDTEDLDCIPAQCDPAWDQATRIDIGRRWTDEMTALAADHDREGRTRFVRVPGVGHDSAGLTDDAQKSFTPAVPDVTNTSEGEAIAALRSAALRHRIGERRLTSLPKDRVFAQVPSAHTEVFIDSEVTLLVSLGVREPSSLALVPNVVGMNEVDATMALRAEEFVVSVSVADDDRPFGEVIGQVPEAGTSISDEREILLVVSSGAGTQN